MKRAIVYITIVCFIAITIIFSAQTNAAAESSDREQVDSVILNELAKAKIPNAAIAIMRGEETEYLFYPDTNKNGRTAADMNTLFQIGSLSKAYTGLGILLLEDEGLLSLDDPVSEYLPWFTVSYDGESVPPEAFTIANLLYQTSGFTNSDKYPSASVGMSVEEGVRLANGKELAFYPSQQYAYANTNYRILGLIIEVVSGRNYNDFLTERILLPLGLNSTYASPENAMNTGLVIEGNRLSFFRAWPSYVPASEGNVPEGYIYSNLRDMGRWVQIQMGNIEVSEQFQRIIKKSHQFNPVSDMGGSHYAAGWSIGDETGEIYHSGSTARFSSFIAIRPQSNIGVCVLTNLSAVSNTGNIAENILNILEGKDIIAYSPDIWVIFDIIFSIVTVLCIIGIILMMVITVRLKRQIRNGKRERIKLTSKRMVYFIPVFILAAGIAVFPFTFPFSFFMAAPLSLFSGVALLLVLSVCVFFPCYYSAVSKKL
ncbi:MAG: beta-lactamase family protein [Oscillospiraceae bacterium]|nr:beta-lactamase family protein [Oscillospiraceae bacterium]